MYYLGNFYDFHKKPHAHVCIFFHYQLLHIFCYSIQTCIPILTTCKTVHSTSNNKEWYVLGLFTALCVYKLKFF
ncbi:hypothetical protein V1478_000882 [Vespula squamosa]|uniref:Uncharacterized protein n=1 Tax=Vespula squamosa TaxID=30214 RepID=A0ABD2C6R2_VESSQ